MCRISASYSIFFLKNLHAISSQWLCEFSQCTRFLFSSTSLPILVTSCLFNSNHFNRYEMISHSSFDLYVLEDLWCWPSFLVSVGYACVFLGKMPFFSAHFPIKLSFVTGVCASSLYTWDINFLTRYMICKYLLPLFQTTDGFLYSSRGFWFDAVPLFYLCFCDLTWRVFNADVFNIYLKHGVHLCNYKISDNQPIIQRSSGGRHSNQL